MLMLGIGALTGGSVVQAVGLVAASALGAPPAQRRLIKNWDLSPPWIIGLASVALAIAAIALSPAIEGASGKPDEGKPAPTDTAAVSKLDDATKQEIQESWKLIANADALCGKATTSFGQTVNAYSKGRADGADAYRAAQSAQSVCMGSFNLIAQTEPAHKLRGAEKKAFNAALRDCSTAARLR
ncbi:MAG: hypothetical protein JWM33_3229 [Caulobacteraceae bacterium]|nr:hypothetical protein [Caulobacteraceae bacterium]